MNEELMMTGAFCRHRHPHVDVRHARACNASGGRLAVGWVYAPASYSAGEWERRVGESWKRWPAAGWQPAPELRSDYPILCRLIEFAGWIYRVVWRWLHV